MKRLYKAQSIIERDALLSRLRAAGIDTLSPPRDMSRKVTESTVDLSLDGYSVFFDGFDIFVDPADTDRANAELIQFLTDIHTRPPEEDARPQADWDRFYFCSIFSLLFPVLPSLLALYFLYRIVRYRVGWPRRRYLFGAALICFAVGWTIPAVTLYRMIRSGTV